MEAFIEAYKKKNEELQKREKEIRERIRTLESTLPAMVMWNMWRSMMQMTQGGSFPPMQLGSQTSAPPIQQMMTHSFGPNEGNLLAKLHDMEQRLQSDTEGLAISRKVENELKARLQNLEQAVHLKELDILRILDRDPAEDVIAFENLTRLATERKETEDKIGELETKKQEYEDVLSEVDDIMMGKLETKVSAKKLEQGDILPLKKEEEKAAEEEQEEEKLEETIKRSESRRSSSSKSIGPRRDSGSRKGSSRRGSGSRKEPSRKESFSKRDLSRKESFSKRDLSRKGSASKRELPRKGSRKESVLERESSRKESLLRRESSHRDSLQRETSRRDSGRRSSGSRRGSRSRKGSGSRRSSLKGPGSRRGSKRSLSESSKHSIEKERERTTKILNIPDNLSLEDKFGIIEKEIHKIQNNLELRESERLAIQEEEECLKGALEDCNIKLDKLKKVMVGDKKDMNQLLEAWDSMPVRPCLKPGGDKRVAGTKSEVKPSLVQKDTREIIERESGIFNSGLLSIGLFHILAFIFMFYAANEQF